MVVLKLGFSIWYLLHYDICKQSFFITYLLNEEALFTIVKWKDFALFFYRVFISIILLSDIFNHKAAHINDLLWSWELNLYYLRLFLQVNCRNCIDSCRENLNVQPLYFRSRVLPNWGFTQVEFDFQKRKLKARIEWNKRALERAREVFMHNRSLLLSSRQFYLGNRRYAGNMEKRQLIVSDKIH